MNREQQGTGRRRHRDAGFRARRLLGLALLSLFAAGLSPAADLACDGVLGNSGGQGPDLVRFGLPAVRGLGLAVDRWGCLWDRGGRGTLVRFAPDGRMLGTYRIASEEHHYGDRVAIAGDRLVLLLRNRLYALACDAAAGSAATSLAQQAEALAPTAWQGRVLVGDTNGLAWLDPASGARTAAGPAYKSLMDLEVGPDGTLYAFAEWKVHVVRDGREVTDDAPKTAPGEKPQWIDGAWYGHAWHSTIRRFDSAFAPAPGVVLGGNSGSFIGHVAESPDIVNGRGLLRLDGNEWAVGCLEGGACLMTWDGVRRQFDITRRIGALPGVNALAVDSQGRVSLGIGFWRWDDTPDAPLREGPGGGPFTQPAPLSGGRFAAAGLMYGQPRLWVGKPEAWRTTAGTEQGLKLPKDACGAAAVPARDGFTWLGISSDGKAYGAVLSRDGSFRKLLDAITLDLAGPPVKAWTSLAADPQGRLLAAADGWILVFEGAAGTWKEARRWRTWGDGAEDGFGKAVWIQADGSRLWVSDRDRQRVLLFDLATGKPAAAFGSLDVAGDDLAHVRGPQAIAATGDRCVVHDAGNQRLLKLRLR